ncbi:hypothetical protein [Massilia orientalis]|jgi:hypothetical protein|uniref:Uncharacterized protein n=1 Tax=Massilia orientalis TaxID=3050128 RepID=A0ACC7MKT9_9BURK|nr:hypothetical protein [Massilia sp. YIM B02787]
MNTLSIKDLALTCELDRGAMAHVRGGHGKMQQPSHGLSPMPAYFPSYNSTVDVDQNLQQFQNVTNATANGSAFIDGVTVHNNTSQFGQNNAVVAH